MTFLPRLRAAIQAFIHPAPPPLRFDAATQRWVLEGDLAVHLTGSLRLSTDKHIILQSGRTPVPGRPGYVHGVWTNPPLNAEGQPVRLVLTRTPEGVEQLLPLEEAAALIESSYAATGDTLTLSPCQSTPTSTNATPPCGHAS